jgi:adenine deaminase
MARVAIEEGCDIIRAPQDVVANRCRCFGRVSLLADGALADLNEDARFII